MSFKDKSGFSLVEVSLSIGIVAFAFVTILGLIPVGLNTFHKTMDLSVGTQIAQRIVSELQETDYDQIVGSYDGKANGFTFQLCPSYRKFDDLGTEIQPDSNPQMLATIVYWVNVRITPVTRLPKANTGPYNPNIATATIQVAYNPVNKDNLFLDPNTNLWTGAYKFTPEEKSAVRVSTHSAHIARNTK